MIKQFCCKQSLRFCLLCGCCTCFIETATFCLLKIRREEIFLRFFCKTAGRRLPFKKRNAGVIFEYSRTTQKQNVKISNIKIRDSETENYTNIKIKTTRSAMFMIRATKGIICPFRIFLQTQSTKNETSKSQWFTQRKRRETPNLTSRFCNVIMSLHTRYFRCSNFWPRNKPTYQ
jgi:hypothetical protein